MNDATFHWNALQSGAVGAAVPGRLGGGATGSGALRIVSDLSDTDDARPTRRALAVEAENRRSAALGKTDARLIVALRASESLEGGRAAVLRPEARRRIVSLATDLGLRAFDTNLIIAIVQDGARRGREVGDADVHGGLRLVGGTHRPTGWRMPHRGGYELSTEQSANPMLAGLVAAILLGMALGGAAIAWVLGVL